jgi:hypothetical protein
MNATDTPTRPRSRRAENRRVTRLLAREQARRIRNAARAGATAETLTRLDLLFQQQRRTRAVLGGSNRVRELYPA